MMYENFLQILLLAWSKDATPTINVPLPKWAYAIWGSGEKKTLSLAGPKIVYVEVSSYEVFV